MTAVLDASVVAELLIGSRLGALVAERVVAHEGDLHVPHLAIVETASVLRSWSSRGEVLPDRAAAALEDLQDLPARRWPAEPFLERMWELRENLSVYDANYVTLAEALDADLLTGDERLARGAASVSRCRVRTLGL